MARRRQAHKGVWGIADTIQKSLTLSKIRRLTEASLIASLAFQGRKGLLRKTFGRLLHLCGPVQDRLACAGPPRLDLVRIVQVYQ